MGLLDEMAPSQPRMLPVVLIADMSGSMTVDGKLEALNSGLQAMLDELRRVDDGAESIHVAIIAFGDDAASFAQPLAPVSEVQVGPFTAAGRTPLGSALALTRDLIEDREAVPSGSYTPTLVLLSDGIPTDEWQGPLEELLAGDRGAVATKMALGIGADADGQVLTSFAADVRRADEARQIVEYLQFVTMTVIRQSTGADAGDGGGTIQAPSLPRWEDERY